MNILNETRRADMTQPFPTGANVTSYTPMAALHEVLARRVPWRFDMNTEPKNYSYIGDLWELAMNELPRTPPNYRELVEQFMRERFCVTDPPFHDTLELSNYRIALYTFADWLQKHAETFP